MCFSLIAFISPFVSGLHILINPFLFHHSLFFLQTNPAVKSAVQSVSWVHIYMFSYFRDVYFSIFDFITLTIIRIIITMQLLFVIIFSVCASAVFQSK